MKFNEDQRTELTELGVKEDALTKVEELTESHEAELKKDWDDKANTDAEAIIQGAANKVETLTGIKRERGQKIADYLDVAGESFVKGSKAALETKKAEYEEKLKAVPGNDDLKQKLQETEEKLDELQKKEADFADYEENDWKGKYSDLQKEVSSMGLNQAFLDVKPTFADGINDYEAKGRWSEFKADVVAKYDVEKSDDGEYVAIDKENKHKVVKLKDLVAKDETIQTLVTGRKKTGLNIHKKDEIKIEGVPFTVPENATPQERTKAIREYLETELKLPKTSNEYATKFADFNQKILAKKSDQ